MNDQPLEALRPNDFHVNVPTTESAAAITGALSIIIPAKNEAASLDLLLPKLEKGFPEAEIVVVDDGSSDETRRIIDANASRAVSHPYSIGNGAAVKAGARNARGEVLVLMDADGQHDPRDVDRLLGKLHEGYDMAVGARATASQANRRRRLGNYIYNRLASLVTGHRIEDLTSGFRAVRVDKFREFLHLLPNGFSYPTTITMAFFRSGYSVAYVPIAANKRQGRSHIKLWRDGVRFLLIIFKIGSLYSPLKVFAPAAAALLTGGVGFYLYTYMTSGRFTNMGALLLLTAITTFLVGLVSEQVTQLLYTTRRAPFRAEDADNPVVNTDNRGARRKT